MLCSGSGVVKNVGPDHKRARRTGLDARRIEGQSEDLQLEVGAQRAPRHLVHMIIVSSSYHIFQGISSEF